MNLTLQIDVVLILLMDSLSAKCLSCKPRDSRVWSTGRQRCRGLKNLPKLLCILHRPEQFSRFIMSIVRPVASLKTISHLLLAGNNCLSPPIEYASRSQQQPSNSSLTVMPFSLWLGSIGRADDVEKGWQIVRGGLGAG
jgi:hypothetical protein